MDNPVNDVISVLIKSLKRIPSPLSAFHPLLQLRHLGLVPKIYIVYCNAVKTYYTEYAGSVLDRRVVTWLVRNKSALVELCDVFC
jgi:hypothetical protein